MKELYNCSCGICSCIWDAALEPPPVCGHCKSKENWDKPVTPTLVPTSTSALDIQVGGSHYKSKGIQPIEYIHANNLNFSEGSIVKYITRWSDKGGIEDLKKVKHYVDLLIEMETRYGRLKPKE